MGFGDKSESYRRRQELLSGLEIPTMSQAREELGPLVADIVFDQMHPVLRKDFGLEPPLEGPGDELWVSPSDLLIGKVCLKPPLTQKHIQALTHQGILEMGWLIEQKFINEMEMEKLRALAEREAYLNRKFELEKQRLISEIRDGEQLRYLEQIETLRAEFDSKMEETIRQFEEQIQQITEQNEYEVDLLNSDWQTKYDEAINETTTRLTQEFLMKMGKQEEIMAKMFNKQLENCEAKKRCAIEFERTQCKEALMQLKHNLECHNIANLMYMLCKERRTCRTQKETITKDLTTKLRKKQQTITTKTRTIKSLTRIKEKQFKQLQVRERCLTEIIKQYQKLLYYALKSIPTQAEFLLDIEKLIRYELSDSCLLDRTIYSDPTSVIFPKPCEMRRSTNLIVKSSDRSQGDRSDVNEMFDHESIYGESDALPAFYFNEKMYVREDFRDMLSANIAISRKHPLWNQEVEELINIFKASVARGRRMSEERSSSKILGKIKSHPSSVRFDHFSQESEEIVENTIVPEAEEPTAKVEQVESPSHHSETVEIYDEMKAQPKDTVSTSSSNPKSESKSEMKAKKMITYSKPEEPRRGSTPGESKPGIVTKTSSTFRKQGSNQQDTYSKSNIVIKSSQTSRRTSTMPSEFEAVPSSTLLPRKSGQATQSRLTLARDSVILRISSMERKSLMNMSTVGKKPDEESSIKSTESLGKNGEKVAREPTPSSAKTSKLLLATDSVEMLRSSTKISGISPEKRASVSVPLDEVELKRRQSFQPQLPKIETKQLKPPQKSIMKSKQKAKVVGDKKNKVHMQNPKEFTEERVNSLVNLMKDNPSLLRLFTSCSK